MPLTVLVPFLPLVAAAGLLAVEAGTGRTVGKTPWGTAGRTAVFAIASAAGVTLLAALSGEEMVVAAALVPLTALSILRFEMLVRRRTTRLRSALVVMACLAVGLAVGLSTVPVPLTRAHLHGEDEAAPANPVSIRRDAGRIVRG